MQGAQFGGAKDDFVFVNKTIEGDGYVVVKVADSTGKFKNSRLGVMFRDGTAAAAAFVMLEFDANESKPVIRLRTRAVASQNAKAGDNVAAKYPIWLKLDRVGNRFIGTYSLDGRNWMGAGEVQSPLATAARQSVFAEPFVYRAQDYVRAR